MCFPEGLENTPFKREILWLKSPKLGAKLRPSASFLWVDSVQGRDVASFFGAVTKGTIFLE